MKINYQTSVYQQARTIAEITEVLVDSFDNSTFDDICSELKHYSKKLPKKIVAAEAGEYYSLKLESAFSVRKAVRELQGLLLLCKSLELAHEDYIKYVISELETFRPLFLEWVASFDKHIDYEDDWSFSV